jgi:hypothetical protein
MTSNIVCREERHCRFCKATLPDWKSTLQTGSKQVTPYMRVSFNGRTHKVPVKPGEDGQKEFAGAIRKLLNLPEEQEFDVSVGAVSSSLGACWAGSPSRIGSGILQLCGSPGPHALVARVRS